MSEITVDVVVASFVSTRDKISELEKAHKKQIALMKEDQEIKQTWLRTYLEGSGQIGAKTSAGTIYFKRKESVRVADWDQILKYIKETSQWELLTKGVAKAAILELMGDLETVRIGDKDVERRPNAMPPGLDYVSIREVGVNRPTKK
jgi:hypothetical protein